MGKTRKTLLGLLFLLLVSTAFVRVAGNPNGFPTAEQQTLMASLAPPNPDIGDDVKWQIWTDPNCSGQEVHLQIIDISNGTVIYEETDNLGTVNQCGSLQKIISTAGYEKHMYLFVASMSVGNMIMNCTRMLDFEGPQIYVYVTPYRAIPGEDVNLTIGEAFYPYVEAYANITVYNSTHPELWTKENVLIPEENGTRIVSIPTAGLLAMGWTEPYRVNVTFISDLGERSEASAWFYLTDLIVEVEYYGYIIGDLVNVSIRTYPTVTQAGLKIYAFGFPPTTVVDEYVALTNGKATRSYDSTPWTPGSYSVIANATIDSSTVDDYDYFLLEAFEVHVSCDKYTYSAGEDVNITISTEPEQPNAKFNITVTNSTWQTVWTYTDHLDGNGQASVLMPTTELPPDSYDVDVWVNNTQYVEWGYEWFEVVKKTFNIEASIDPPIVSDYAMPHLTITTDLGQTNANLSLMCHPLSCYGDVYMFNKTNFDCSSYEYLLPMPGMGNNTYYVEVIVASDAGTNRTFVSLSYSHGLDSDGDGLPDVEESIQGTVPIEPDSDGDGFFDGIEVFHGSDPLNLDSVIPEPILVPMIVLLTFSTFTVLAVKLRRRKSYH